MMRRGKRITLPVRAWENGDHDYRISGGESFNDMRRRFVPFVERLVADHGSQQGSAVLVSHGSILHLMLPELLANIDYAFSKQHPLRNCAAIVARQQRDGLSCVEWDGHEI